MARRCNVEISAAELGLLKRLLRVRVVRAGRIPVLVGRGLVPSKGRHLAAVHHPVARATLSRCVQTHKLILKLLVLAKLGWLSTCELLGLLRMRLLLLLLRISHIVASSILLLCRCRLRS